MFANETNTPGLLFNQYFVKDVLLMILYLITAILAVFGNCCVCKIVYDNRRMRTKTNLMIASMAFSDVLAGLVIPAQWTFCSSIVLQETGEYLCAMCKSIQKASYFLSTLTMVTIAVHRYNSIFFPRPKELSVKGGILLTWMFGLLCAVTNFASVKIFEYFTPKELITCRVVIEFQKPFDSKLIRKFRVGFTLMGQFLLPLIVTVFLYTRIMVTVKRRELVGQKSPTRTQKLNESKRKTILMLIIVLIVFTLCWLPLSINKIVDFFFKNVYKKNGKCNKSTYYLLIYWLSISSCVYNPIIYYVFDPKFRNNFKNLFRKKDNLQRQPSFHNSTKVSVNSTITSTMTSSGNLRETNL